MSSAFFYRERMGMFVVVVLAIWLVLLGLYGRYMPANASIGQKQMLINMGGTEVMGLWAKENGRWVFKRISKVIKFKSSESRQLLSARPALPVNNSGTLATSDASSPETTASVSAYSARKVNKRALRAQLADEIGRWAKIGNRWEWHENQQKTLLKSKVETPRGERQPQGRWARRNGVWIFDKPTASEEFIYI